MARLKNITSRLPGQNFTVLHQKKKDMDIFFNFFNIILCYFIREKICLHLPSSDAKLSSFHPAGGLIFFNWAIFW
jgi:hypothetical protein